MIINDENSMSLVRINCENVRKGIHEEYINKINFEYSAY